MSSWDSPYPPERRRSRSRSPDRRMMYERDWPRDREWPEHDRDRNEWEYNRAHAIGIRPRSRSPPPPGYDGRRMMKRRRSMSPPFGFDRDRYDSRPRYGGDYQDYRGPPGGRYSPPRGYAPHSPPRPRGPIDPHELDYPATFRYFSDWFRLNFPGVVADEDSQGKNVEADPNVKTISPMKKRYDEYRRGITCQQVQILFEHHKNSAWFLERYDLSEQYVNLRKRTRKIGWRGKIDEFVQKLDEGAFDPTLELNATPPSSHNNANQPATEGAPTASEQNGENGDVEMTDEQMKEEEMDIAMFDGEANGEGGPTATPSGPDRSNIPAQPFAEEISSEPEGIQIMIRTIPPDIGRIKIEEICSKIPGFMYLALGDPMQKRNYYRCGWIRLADDVDITEVLAKLSEAKIDGFRLQVTHSNRPFISKMRMAPSAASSPDRVLTDLNNIRKLAGLLETQAEELAQTSFDELEMNESDVKDRGSQAVEARLKHLSDALEQKFQAAEEERLTAKKNSIALDLYLAYLRTAFHCCYYCAAVADHNEELLRKCIKHGRSPPTIASDWKATRWLQWLDSKVALLIDKDNVDPTAYGGKGQEQELKKLCASHVRREDEGKFRCSVCSKLFKAESFVEKHINNKHPELVASLADIPFFNMFALDPHRIQPFAHAPPANGTQQAPPQAFGLKPAPREREREFYNGGPRYAEPPRPQHHMSYPPPGPPPFGHYGEYPGPPPSESYYGRRSPPNRRRLSERLGDRAHDLPPLILTGSEGLPAKPSIVAEPMSDRPRDGPPLAKIKQDPRAASGRKVSYLDMDEVAEGDVELSY